jgi:hypothetical protein
MPSNNLKYIPKLQIRQQDKRFDDENVVLALFILCSLHSYRPFALTSQILRVSSRCSLTISVRVQQPHTAQELTILIQNYYKLLKNLLCLLKLYYA